MARMVSTEVWDTVNSVIGCLNFRWCCDQHIHGMEHLITCLWAAIELVYLWMEPGGTSLAPSPRYPAGKLCPQTHFEENYILCLDKKNVHWQEKCFFVFTKNPLWVVWNGEMIRKYELSVPCLTGHTPRLTFQRFPQFNTKLRLRVHFQSNLDQLIMLLFAILKNLSHVHLDHGVGTTHNQNKQVGNAGWEFF